MSTIIEDAASDVAVRHPKRPRRSVLLTAAGLVLASAGAAWALTNQPEQSTSVQCPENTIIPAVSGDPVADCSDDLRRQGIEPPAMTAYVNENGGVVVVAAGEAVPSVWTLLEADFRQDTVIIELQAAIADVTTGLAADCYDGAEAVGIVRRELARLNLDWGVELRDNPDGTSTCAIGLLEPENDVVTIAGVDGTVSVGDEPWVALGTQLEQVLAADCLTVDKAAEVATQIARDVGIDPSTQIHMSTTVDEQATCARSTVTVGGVIFVDLRGPRP